MRPRLFPGFLALTMATGCPGTGGDVEGPPTPSTVRVEVRPLTCADPAGRAEAFFDVVPLDVPPPSIRFLWGAAAAVGDVDADLDLDVVVLGEAGPVLFRGPGFEPEPLEPLDQPAGAVLADIDGDSDLDLYLARFEREDAVLFNDGSGRFLHDPLALDGVDTRSTAAVSFADIDGDGDLDGWAGSFGTLPLDPEVPVRHFEPSPDAYLWINRGDGTLVDRGSELLPIEAHRGYTLAGGFHDLDRDGHVDLYVVNDFGQAHGENAWLRGNGDGSFTWEAGPHGLNLTTTGMGLGVGDVNGDGFDDLAIGYWGGVRLMESFVSPQVAWFDQTAVRLPMDLPGSRVAWGADHADLDNDADLDLLVHFAYLEWYGRFDNREDQIDRLFLAVPDQAAYVDGSALFGLDDPGGTRGSVLADLDDDGWLDLVRPSQTGPAILLSRCGVERGLRVQLHQDGPNPHGIGAHVAILGDRPQRRTVRAGGTGYGSAGPPEVHFGVGEVESVTLEVHWPDGDLHTLEAVPTQAHVTVARTPPAP